MGLDLAPGKALDLTLDLDRALDLNLDRALHLDLDRDRTLGLERGLRRPLDLERFLILFFFEERAIYNNIVLVLRIDFTQRKSWNVYEQTSITNRSDQKILP